MVETNVQIIRNNINVLVEDADIEALVKQSLQIKASTRRCQMVDFELNL